MLSEQSGQAYARIPASDREMGELGMEQANFLLKLQRDILELVSQSRDNQLTLDELCIATEALLPNSVASVMLFNDAQTELYVKSAPSMRKEAVEALNGLEPGPNAGSCGTAVFSDEPQFVCDTSVDPRWAAFRDYAIDFNVCACWSFPIRISENKVIGSLALASHETRWPSPFHRRLLETAAHLASIVLERQKEQEHLWYLAHHDVLTGLPNRTLFNVQIDHAIQQAKRNEQQFALLFLDLDRFKDINDTQGHDTGDSVLTSVAAIIKNCVRDQDLLARLGGDEFVLLISDLNQTLDVHRVAEKIVSSFDQPVDANGQPYDLSVSIGISIFPEDGADLHTLQKNSDIAMYEAKTQGRARYVFYQKELTAALNYRIDTTTNLRLALDNDELVVHFHPEMSNRGNDLKSAEALVRWQRPGVGLVAPMQFIPIAEETGMINRLGESVIRKACLQCLQWWQYGLPEFNLGVNLSLKQLEQGFAGRLAGLLREIDFPANRLEFEVTESVIMTDHDDVIAELLLLRDAGIGILLDDFGTGQSSLAALKRLPITKLKIDRSFVANIPDDPSDVAIAKTIIAMGHCLDLEVVAEGVETAAQREFLRQEGCDLLQGYLYCEPLPAEEFATRFLKTH